MLSLTLDFYSLKYACVVAAKEGRDTGMVDLLGFFLQTKADKKDNPIIKITRAIALLLVECDSSRWKKYLKREKGKWIIYAICNKVIYRTLNAAFIAYKKLTNILSS